MDLEWIKPDEGLWIISGPSHLSGHDTSSKTSPARKSPLYGNKKWRIRSLVDSHSICEYLSF